MANPTTNYSFAMPTNTDLVKDLPADFDIFGQAVDDRIKALNPETTAGDISYHASTANAKTRLPIGTANQVLAVNSGATAPEWKTIQSGGMTLLSTTTLSGTSTTVSGIDQTYTDLVVIVNNPYVNTAIDLRIDPNSTNSISYWSGTYTSTAYADTTMYSVHNMPTTSTVQNSIGIWINQYANTSFAKPFRYSGNFNGAGSPARVINYGGAIATASAITAMKFLTNNGTSTFSGGQVLIYGVK
jgi:hypothetical protein